MNINFPDRQILLEFDTIDVERYGDFENKRRFERELIKRIKKLSKKLSESQREGSANYVIIGGGHSLEMFQQAMAEINQANRANIDIGEFLE